MDTVNNKCLFFLSMLVCVHLRSKKLFPLCAFVSLWLILFLFHVPAAFAQREPWTASRLNTTPEPPKHYITRRVFDHLTFDEALEIVPSREFQRMFLLGRKGMIWALDTRQARPEPEVFADLKQVEPGVEAVYGMAFHPRFAQNREVFICYVLKNQQEDGSRVCRFKVSSLDPPRLDPAGRRVLLTFRSGGHNGGQLQFGPDGMLYISTGDSEVPNPPDPLDTGQDLSDLLSSVLRIDVDHADPGKPYAIPADNPFVNFPGARPEIWAYGFRNPWKMTFHPHRGDLWLGDIGWDTWEMIHRVERGGNYGWPAMEGPLPVKNTGKRGPTPILPPVVAHPHTESASITGGFFYFGDRLPELRGAYVYGDFATGKIWALWHDGKQITRRMELADTSLQIVTFGLDPAGELYMVDWKTPTTLHQLIPNPAAGKPGEFPRKLSQAGLFADLKTLRPMPGVEPFRIAWPMWADGAVSQYHIALPGDTAIKTWVDRNQNASMHSRPAGMAAAKTIAIESDGLQTRIETQVLQYDGLMWHAYSYRWNADQTDADLVDAQGDQSEAMIGGRKANWRFFSRAECLRCHYWAAGSLLAFTPGQLAAIPGQVERFADLGIVNEVFVQRSPVERIFAPDDPAASVADRARSWLHVNCSHCHRLNAGAAISLRLDRDADLKQMKILDAKPMQGDFGVADARLIAPGDPCRSILLHRIAKNGSGHMPQIGPTTPDPKGFLAMRQWIESLAPAPENQILYDDSRIEKLLESPAGAMRLLMAIESGQCKGAARDRAADHASRSKSLQVRELLERYLPEDRRSTVLGAKIDPRSILALIGEPKRGAELFAAEGKARCGTCHIAKGVGRDFGPDLSQVALRLTGPQMLESILQPSKVIDPRHTGWFFTLKDGRVITGLIASEDARLIRVKQIDGRVEQIPAAQIAGKTALPASLMPEGLLANLSAHEAADLLAYLLSMR